MPIQITVQPEPPSRGDLFCVTVSGPGPGAPTATVRVDTASGGAGSTVVIGPDADTPGTSYTWCGTLPADATTLDISAYSGSCPAASAIFPY